MGRTDWSALFEMEGVSGGRLLSLLDSKLYPLYCSAAGLYCG